jgi:hypothetical protein
MRAIAALNAPGVATNREEIATYSAISRVRRFYLLRSMGLALGISFAAGLSTSVLAAEPVLVPFPHDFAESITATSNGALIFSSFTGGRISRAAPGATEASEWIKPGSNGLLSVLGVLTDEASNTLYACSVDASGFGVVVPSGTKPGALKTFDLKTGAPKASYDVPAGRCATTWSLPAMALFTLRIRFPAAFFG